MTQRNIVRLTLVVGAVLALSAATASAQTDDLIWELPQSGGEPTGLLVCPAGDGPVAVVRVWNRWEWDGQMNLTVSMDCDAWTPCSGWWGACDFTVAGVYEGNGWHRFELQPDIYLDWPYALARLRAEAPGTVINEECPDFLEIRSVETVSNGAVDLSDVQTFSSIFYSSNYSEVADFNFDDTVNLSDVPYISAHLGHSCAGTGSATEVVELEKAIADVLTAGSESTSLGGLKARF